MNQSLLPVGILLLVGMMFFRDPAPPEAAEPAASAAPAPAAPAPAPFATPVAPPVVAPSAPPPAATGNEIVLVRAPDGHFYADALVNGSSVRFMIDTGASSVALTRGDADRIGLAAPDAAFTGTAMGAGGPIAIRPVTLDRIAVGSFEASGVAGAVVREGLGVSLLGQSYLSRIAKLTIEGDRMTLR